MRKKLPWAAALATALAIAVPARAATVEVRECDDHDPKCATISVRGEIKEGDGDRFLEATKGVQKAVVTFHSPGGEVTAGLTIGKRIKEAGWSTWVGDGSICVSVCAAAWVAGKVRWASTNSGIGFHSFYLVDGRGKNLGVSSVHNALVGAFYGTLGLSDRAIIYMTTAAPTKMRWFTFDDADRIGLKVSKIEKPKTESVADSKPVKTEPVAPWTAPAPYNVFQR